MRYNEKHPLVWNMAKRLVDPDEPWLPSFVITAVFMTVAYLLYLLTGIK